MSTQATSSNSTFTQLNPLHHANAFIDMLRNLQVEEREPIHTNIPNPLEYINSALDTISEYHKKIAKQGSEWSVEMKLTTENFVKPLFFPIAFCQIGKSIRNYISEDLLGNLVRVVAFIAFQVLHAVPYIVGAALTSGAIFLYHVATVATITLSASALLAVQVYYNYRLVKEIEVTNQILDQRLEQISRRFDVILLFKNTGYSSWDLMKRTLKAAASLWPAKN